MSNRFFTLQQAADQLLINIVTLRRLIKAGKIKAVKVSVRRVLVPVSEIDRILNGGIDG
jgi:excisionase family DNA binding protein